MQSAMQFVISLTSSILYNLQIAVGRFFAFAQDDHILKVYHSGAMAHAVGVILSRQAKDLLPRCKHWSQITRAECDAVRYFPALLDYLQSLSRMRRFFAFAQDDRILKAHHRGAMTHAVGVILSRQARIFCPDIASGCKQLMQERFFLLLGGRSFDSAAHRSG